MGRLRRLRSAYTRSRGYASESRGDQDRLTVNTGGNWERRVDRYVAVCWFNKNNSITEVDVFFIVSLVTEIARDET